jgi:hypothetical protein
MLCKSLKENRNLKKGVVSENIQCTNLTVWLTVKEGKTCINVDKLPFNIVAVSLSPNAFSKFPSVKIFE